MGVVYKAEDIKLKRPVALKFLPPELTHDEEAKKRFVHEAQAASALDHPNICTIYEIGETEDGQLFIVMAYYEGETLKKKVGSGQLSVNSVIDIAIQIAQGLAKSHEKDIVHRDIKPANVMITIDGVAKILDFGLAKLAGQAGLTKAGITLGTPAYMSPEQTRGEEVDHRTDIWSLGVALYEMLTGSLPFKGEYEQAVIYSILHEKPEPIMPTVSAPAGTLQELEKIVSKALAKEPAKRYQHVDEMLQDLRFIADGRKSQSARASAKRPAPRKRALLYGGMAAFLILLVVTGLYFYPLRSETTNSLAVLPLANLSGDSNQEFFADGMTEALISVLGEIDALRVISRTSVMQYKGGTKPLPEISRELDVNMVVEGSVRSSGNRVGITVRLVEGRTEKRLWSGTFERELRDVLRLQREVALAIAQEIRVEITPQEQARLKEARAVDPEAYELYLWGRKFRDKETMESLQQAAKNFEQAIAKAPDFALAHAELTVPYLILAGSDVTFRKDAEAKSRAAVAKALELDEHIPEAHIALGVIREFWDWDWAGAEQAFKRAIALNPSNREAHREYGLFLSRRGKTDAGLAEIKHAQKLDPFSEIANAYALWAYIYDRQFDAAIEQSRKAVALDSKSGLKHFMLGQAYLHKKMFHEAIAVFESEAVASLGWSDAFAFLGCAYALSGNREKPLQMIDELQAQYEQEIDVVVHLAIIYTGLGEKNEALTWLELAHEKRSGFLVDLILNPVFAPLQSEPRFQALLEKMKLN